MRTEPEKPPRSRFACFSRKCCTSRERQRPSFFSLPNNAWSVRRRVFARSRRFQPAPFDQLRRPQNATQRGFPVKQPRAAWCAENSAPPAPHLAHPTSPAPCRPRRTACAVPARPAPRTPPRSAQRREPTPHRNRSLENTARRSGPRVPFDRRRRAEPEPCERIQQPDPNSVYTSNYPENR